MNARPCCILYTRDKDLARRATAFLNQVADVRPLDTAKKLADQLARDPGVLLLLDSRADGSEAVLPHVVGAQSPTLAIVLGKPGSDPWIHAQQAGAYAVEDVDVDGQRIRAVVVQALEHLELLQENRALKEEVTRAAALKSVLLADPRRETSIPLQPARHFPGALRQLDNVEALLQNLVEGVSGSVMVSRVGIFCRSRDTQSYRLRASLRCLEDTAALEYAEQDSFVQWLTLNAHIVARDHLEHVREAPIRMLLTRVLNALGAEVLVPLQVRERLLGWMFLGHRATGLPFGQAELENLALISEHVSSTIENALLYEEVAIQKTLAETLLHSMPTGIVAVDEHGVVRWFNSVARQILETTQEDVLGREIEVLGSRLADKLHGALGGDVMQEPEEWFHAPTKRTLAVLTRRLENASACLGAVALVQDITVERMLEEKEEQLERAAFWTELAAAMSHEIRNPLVAIKTFAQLLPERYDDAEFRSEFSETVAQEIARLNNIVDQINQFAHPPKLEFRPLNIRQAIKLGLDRALASLSSSGVWVDTAIDDDLPLVEGDENALSECFAHLIANAMEALQGHENPRIVLAAKEHRDGEIADGIAVSVYDNAGGIRSDICGNVFSPFCTTKARGMGLGLPIVKRAVVDHNGRVHIESSEKGTCVTIILPGNPHREQHETHSHRGRRAGKP